MAWFLYRKIGFGNFFLLHDKIMFFNVKHVKFNPNINTFYSYMQFQKKFQDNPARIT